MAVKLLLWRLWRWVWFSRDRESFWTLDLDCNVDCMGSFAHGLVVSFSDGVVGYRIEAFQWRR